jgi:hypothetical protein
MLKHRKTHIVSRLFDTINKMSLEKARESACEAETCEAETCEAETCEAETCEAETCEAETCEAENTKKYIVSVPTLPLKITRSKPIVICTYQVRTDGLYPFIMFLLTKKEVTFIKVEHHKNIKYAAIAYMHSILPRATIAYAGFYESDENNIIILSAEDTNIIQSDYIWATSFELINLKHIMNSQVNPAVIAFFKANKAFLLLKDEGNRIYESPMVGYKTHENTCDETEMDIYRETIIPSLGKCYYIDIRKTDSSIMRIAFFAGKMVLNKEKPYDSMLCGANQYYIIQDYDQHIVL